MRGFRPYGGGYSPSSEMFPPVIKWLLIANTAMFLLPRIIFANLDFIYSYLGLVPARIWSDFYLWQLVTYMFLHGSMWHILMNMFILWMFGSELERTWGSREFTNFYFAAGIGAGIINVAFAALRPEMSMIPIIGASGAIYGILVAYAMLFPDRYVYVYFLFPVKVKYLVIFLVAVEFFSTYQADGVAHFAHLGGALVGFLYLRYSWRWKLQKWSPAEFLRRLKTRAMTGKKAAGTQMMDEVDAILDKINKVGYDNLTRKEKKILEKASDRLSRHGPK
jgi:membrane associated rhomboid family serine protease